MSCYGYYCLGCVCVGGGEQMMPLQLRLSVQVTPGKGWTWGWLTTVCHLQANHLPPFGAAAFCVIHLVSRLPEAEKERIQG